MKREAECLKRLFNRDPSYFMEIVQFLESEGLITSGEVANLTRVEDQVHFTYTKSNKLIEQDLLFLFDYEWVVLPKEKIKITIVTRRTTKELSVSIQ